MGVAFTDQADFSNISDEYRLYINKALHQAFIETNEEGTEAAAATVIGIGVVSMPYVLELKLDRPFLFVIREISTNAILFMGRVSDPSAS
jgi:serine protease inhibitor